MRCINKTSGFQPWRHSKTAQYTVAKSKSRHLRHRAIAQLPGPSLVPLHPLPFFSHLVRTAYVMLLAITNHSLVSLSDLHGTRVLIKKARRTDEARVAQNWLNEIDILKRVAGGVSQALVVLISLT